MLTFISKCIRRAVHSSSYDEVYFCIRTTRTTEAHIKLLKVQLRHQQWTRHTHKEVQIRGEWNDCNKHPNAIDAYIVCNLDFYMRRKYKAHSSYFYARLCCFLTQIADEESV